jgi:hypothetical protein
MNQVAKEVDAQIPITATLKENHDGCEAEKETT